MKRLTKSKSVALRAHAGAKRVSRPECATTRAAAIRSTMDELGESPNLLKLRLGDGHTDESVAALAVALGNGWSGWPRKFVREAASIVELAREVRDAKRSRTRVPNVAQRLGALSRHYCFHVRRRNSKAVVFGLDLCGGDSCRVDFLAA